MFRKLILFKLIILLLITMPMGGSGKIHASPANPYEEVDEIREEIEGYEETIELLSQDIESRLARLDELDQELADIERDLDETEADLIRSQEKLDEATDRFGGRVRSSYMKGGSSYLETLLEADNLGDLIIRFAYINRIADRDAELISAIREEQENTEAQRIAIIEQRENIEDRQFQLVAERRNLEEQREALSVLLAASQEDLEEALRQISQTETNPSYGVVLDNHPNARPQHGLSQANLVYEYEVEGRSTRYLALFSRLPNKVGPIRSAREHSIMLAWENNVNLVTAGGRRANMRRINDWGVSYTNALADAGFYRDNARRAPHNLYTNLSNLNRGTSSPGTILRPRHISREGSPGSSVSVQYSDNYRVAYQYDSEQEAYRRTINGNAHRDATGEPILARNIIFQYVDHPTDWRGRTDPQVVGSGRIDYYVLGQHFTGRWQKDSRDGVTRFYYEDGQEIERIYGQTWIQIARPR